MFPICKQQPYSESGKPDTRFNNNNGTFGGGIYATKRYFVCAAGKPIHGLNIDSTLVNRFDFDSVKVFSGFQFATADDLRPFVIEKRWDSESYQSLLKKKVVTQISGYRCGDVNMLKVPGVNSTRIDNPYDIAKNHKWKSYALISSNERYIFGYALGKKQWVCSFGVGRSYTITLNGSSGSAISNRIFNFSVQNFGVIGQKLAAYPIAYDTQKKDYISRTATDILTSYIPENLRGFETWRIEDFSTNGQKVLCSAYFRGSDLTAYENDGVNDATTSPILWIEFTFTEANSNTNALAVTHKVIKNYSENTDWSIIRYFSTDYTEYGGKIENPDSSFSAVATGKTTYYPNPAQGELSSSTEYVYSTIEKTYNANGQVVYTSVDNGYNDGYILAASVEVTPRLGYAKEVSNVDEGTERIVHICYDNADLLSYTKLLFVKHNASITETTGISVTGSATKNAYYNAASTQEGKFTSTVSTERKTVNSASFEMMCNNVSAGKLRFSASESITNSTTVQVYDFATNTSNSTTTVQNTPSFYTCVPPISMGRLYAPIQVGYAILSSSRMTSSFFRDDGYAIEELGAKIWPFMRVESNKIVSFNIGVADGSMQIEEQGTGANGQYPILYPVLVPGLIKMRWVYNLYKREFLSNSNLNEGLPANPAQNIHSSNYICTFNPATSEAVLNSHKACCYT